MENEWLKFKKKCKPVVANKGKSLASCHMGEQDQALCSEDERVRSTVGVK